MKCLFSLQAVAQEGLGDRFQPSVKASCVGGTMTIRVDTQEPFEGIIHGPNRTEAGCSVVGRGGTKTYLRIDLTKTDGQTGGCGVKYNAVSTPNYLMDGNTSYGSLRYTLYSIKAEASKVKRDGGREMYSLRKVPLANGA